MDEPGQAGGAVRVLAVGWGEARARRLARALGADWAVAMVATADEAARHLAVRPADAVLLVPEGRPGELRALLDACAGPAVPVYVCPPDAAEGDTLGLLA